MAPPPVAVVGPCCRETVELPAGASAAESQPKPRPPWEGQAGESIIWEICVTGGNWRRRLSGLPNFRRFWGNYRYKISEIGLKDVDVTLDGGYTLNPSYLGIVHVGFVAAAADRLKALCRIGSPRPFATHDAFSPQLLPLKTYSAGVVRLRRLVSLKWRRDYWVYDIIDTCVLPCELFLTLQEHQLSISTLALSYGWHSFM